MLYTEQKGQTIIETVVAIFMLVMGVGAATGLAIYAFSTSNNIINQIVATGLAREGVEAVKNMRDTNWLKLTLDTDCYNFASSPVGQSNASCYKDWLSPSGCGGNGNNKGYCIDSGGSAQSYTLSVDTGSHHKIWSLNQTNSNFGLDLSADVGAGGFQEFFMPHGGGAHGNSKFYRKIILQQDTIVPFQTNAGPRVTVTSQVWWTDGKKCGRAVDFSSANATCRIQLQTKLTNWKDYQP